MAMVITQAEMLQYAGKDKAVFSAGTIVTPLARDFAAENNIRIVIEELCPERENTGKAGETGGCDVTREGLLRDIVRTVGRNLGYSERHVSRDELEEIVVKCIERIGCRVIM